MKLQTVACALAVMASGLAMAGGGHHGADGGGGFWISSGTEGYGKSVKVGNGASWDATFTHGDDMTFGFSGGWSTMDEGKGFQESGGMGWGEYDYHQEGPCGGPCDE